MTKLDIIPRESRPIWVILSRLRFHSEEGSGRVLDGVMFDESYTISIVKPENLPYVQITDVTSQDARFPGASNRRLGVVLQDTKAVVIAVVTDRKNGLTRMDYTDPESGDGLLDVVAAVKTAIETNLEGERDAFLEGTLPEPFTFTQGSIEADDVRIVTEITLSYNGAPFYQGTRSDKCA